MSTSSTESISVVPAEHTFGEYVRQQIEQHVPSIAAARVAAQHHDEVAQLNQRLDAASDETMRAMTEATMRWHMLQGAADALRHEAVQRWETRARLEQAERVLGLVKGMAVAGQSVPVEDLRTVLAMQTEAAPFRPYVAYHVESTRHAYGHFKTFDGDAGIVYPFVGWGLVVLGPESDKRALQPLFRVESELMPEATIAIDRRQLLDYLT